MVIASAAAISPGRCRTGSGFISAISEHAEKRQVNKRHRDADRQAKKRERDHPHPY
jgi:hypothetical protein